MIPGEYIPEPGDIFACWGSDWISRGISLPTSSLIGPRGLRWAPSHVAIACQRFAPNESQCFWWESTSLTDRPCLESHRTVSGVQVHTIGARMQDYLQAGGRVSVYRLSRFDKLSHDERIDLRLFLYGLIAEEYDTLGAVVSGTRLIRHVTLWRNQLDTMFCSEMIAVVLQWLTLMCRENPSVFTPGRLLRQLVTQGTYHLHTQFRSMQDWSDTCLA